MMGYSEESKSYWLFDPIKQQIIISQNVIFNEKNCRIKLLNSGMVYSVLFDIVEDWPTVPSFEVSTSSSIFILDSTSSQSILTEPVEAFYQQSKVDNRSLRIFLPQWATKTIEVVGPNVGDVTVGQQNHNQKKIGSVSLMTRVLQTYDLETFEESKG